jgi:hypothetical protein
MTKQSDMMVGRLDSILRLLLRLDLQLQAPLFNRIASRPAVGVAVTPVAGLLLDLPAGRHQDHIRRLWINWSEPVLQRNPCLLAESVR